MELAPNGSSEPLNRGRRITTHEASVKTATKVDRAVELLRNMLANGEVPLPAIRNAAEVDGISWGVLKHARKRMNIKSRRNTAANGCLWRLPDTAIPTVEAIPEEITGGCRTIPLTRGKVVICDAEDYDRLIEHKWSYSSGGYAARENPTTRTKVLLHREVLGLKYGDRVQVDHANGNPLDCRKCNLRLSTQSQNNMNRRRNSNNTSGFKGVSLYKPTGQWRATIGIGGKQIHLGLFRNLEEACLVRVAAAERLHGEFARHS